MGKETVIFSNQGISVGPGESSTSETLLKGVKFDNDKLRYDLLPQEAIEELVKVLTFGAKKYGDRNWEKGINFSRLIAAARRHESKFLQGEMSDSETLTIHLANSIINKLMILQFILLGRSNELDDLPNKEKRTPQKAIEEMVASLTKGIP